MIEFATMLLGRYAAGDRWMRTLVNERRHVIVPMANAIGLAPLG